MVVFDKRHLKLTIVFLALACKEVRSKTLLTQNIVDILFIRKHTVNRRYSTLVFAGNYLGMVFLEIFLDFANAEAILI